MHLTTRALNRALLDRQLLLARAPHSITKTVEQMGGIQNQYAPSGYVAAWSRTGARRNDLTDALNNKTLVQATVLRGTIHVVTARDYHLLTAAVRESRRAWWVRAQRKALDGIDMRAVAKRVRSLLRNEHMRAQDLQRALAKDGIPRVAAVSAGYWIDIVRVPPSGTWEQRRADLYALASDWLGTAETPTEEEGIAHVVRRYLGAFGPARVEDIANWAGLPVTKVRPATEKLKQYEDGLLDLPRAKLPDPETPAPVRFLPTWDAALLVHARRTQILPEELRARVFNTKTPHSLATFTVDGAVAGAWKYEKKTITLEPFVKLARATLKELNEESERLRAFHA